MFFAPIFFGSLPEIGLEEFLATKTPPKFGVVSNVIFSILGLNSIYIALPTFCI